MISGDLRRSGGVDLREGVESSVPQDDALLNSTLRPHRCGRQGHPSMRPATKRWGRRLEGPLAEVARTASAFLARSAEGEAPSYGSNAAALSLYSQQRWRRVLTRVLVPTCFASTCCHGASAPRAMIQSPWPERCGSQRPMGRCAGRHAQALHRSEHWRRAFSFRIQLSLFCRLEQPVQPFSGWWTARSLHADPHLVHTARRRHHMDQPDGLCLWSGWTVCCSAYH